MPAAPQTAAPVNYSALNMAPAAKLSSDQFAQQIKTKYPAYASIDNATLTQKILAKYPQYGDRVDLTPAAPAPAPSMGSSILAGAKQALGGVFGVSDAINKTVAQPFVDVAAAPVQALAKKMGQPDPYANGAMADIPVNPVSNVGAKAGSAALATSYALPVGRIAAGASKVVQALGVGAKAARVVGEAGTSVGTGYGLDVAANANQGKTGNDVFKPGVGTAIGAALPGAAAVSAGVRKLAPAMAPRIINSLVKPLLKDFSYGKNPGRTVAELGITGNNLEDLATNITKARQKIGQQAHQLGSQLDPQTKVSVSHALSPIDEAMTAAARNNDSTVLDRLQSVKRAITKVLVPVTNSETGLVSIAAARDRQLTDLPYTAGLKVKQLIGDLTKFTGNQSDDKAVNMALKKAYGNVKGALDKAATDANPEVAGKLRTLNEQYADLTSAEVATKYRDKINARQNLISLPATATGIGAAVVTAISTGGAAVPAILAGASGIAVEKALSTPAVKTRVAAALAKMKPTQAEGLFNKLPFLRNFRAPGDTLIDNMPATNNRGFIKVLPSKKIHPEDLATMRDFTDYVNGAYKPAPAQEAQLKKDAQVIADHYGMKSAMGSDKALANEFGKHLDTSGLDKKITAKAQEHDVETGRFLPKKGNVEQLAEQADGFKPGDKEKFDRAILRKDAATIKAMLPQIPQEYKTRFGNNIRSILGTGKVNQPVFKKMMDDLSR